MFGFVVFLTKKIINADDLKTNCQMKRLQSGTAGGFADTMQLFPELNSSAGEQ